jgi:hypothetical protein
MSARCSAVGVGHRYQILRFTTYGLTVLAMFLVPGLHLIKFDVPAGVSYLWGEPAPALRVIQVFLYFTLITLLVILWSTYPFGRMFCGWSCPGGQMARLSRWLRKGWGKRRPFSRHLIAGGTGFLFALLALNWFTHLGILWEPDQPAFVDACSWVSTGARSSVPMAGTSGSWLRRIACGSPSTTSTRRVASVRPVPRRARWSSTRVPRTSSRIAA